MKHTTPIRLLVSFLATQSLSGCDPDSLQNGNTELSGSFELTGFVENPALDEISGMETSGSGDFFVHNDEGKPLLYVLDPTGKYRSQILLDGGKNRDWEDMTIVPVDQTRWVVMGDIGDNEARYKSMRLYFFPEPEPDANGRYPESVTVQHRLEVRYPDGPRDCEAMAYDPVSGQILFMSKRDRIPRLYGLLLDEALNEDSVELEFLGEIPTFTPPTAEEMLRSGNKAWWLSQPTGLDISADGLLAAVITYRSLYLYHRDPDETWIQAFQKQPEEFIGPPGVYEEAVTLDAMNEVYVTTEKVPTPVYRLKQR